MVALTRSILR